MYKKIIDNFYPETGRLREILLTHSRGVADLALRIYDSNPHLFEGEDRECQRQFVYTAAMLHDIGIIRCDAAGIECYGTEPYICHGTIGASMIRSLDAPLFGIDADTQEALARVCERHTGTGLTIEDIQTQHLPLPPADLSPQTIVEQLICYADKFFSKTRPDKMKTYEHAERSLMKFGEASVARFRHWHDMFGLI